MSDGSSKIWNSKKECRSYFKSLCANEFAPKFVHNLYQKQRQLNTNLRDWMSKQKGSWGAYRSLKQEASVDEVFQISHLDWVFPRVLSSSEVSSNPVKGLEFCRARSFNQGAFGIQEPDQTSEVVPLSGLQGLLIPGLAFDRHGHRLGKGQGYYDRALQNFTGIKVGVCFEFQVSEQMLPVEEHDQKMDVLMTEKGVYMLPSWQKK